MIAFNFNPAWLDHIPWDMIASIFIAAFGSQWFGQYFISKKLKKQSADMAEERKPEMESITSSLKMVEENQNKLKEQLDSVEAKQKELSEKQEQFSEKQEQYHEEEKADKSDSRRYAILKFDGELKRDVKHTYEEFNEIINTIDKYETYCDTHKDTYENSKAVDAISNIKATNKRLAQERGYL